MKVIFLIFALFFSSALFAESMNNKLDTIQETVTIFNTKLSLCSDLNDISCVKYQLKQMNDVDQYLRNHISTSPELNLWTLITKQDAINSKRLKLILAIHFWPKISLFGQNADSHAWLIAQHADHDTPFQHEVLFALEQMTKINEAKASHYAYLYDRIAMKYNEFGIKQRYGTQAQKEDDNRFVIKNLEGSESEVDERRLALGLPILSEYRQDLNIFYAKN